MNNDLLMRTALTFLMRRGLTLLGGSASQLSDSQITAFVGVALVIGNELWQLRNAYKAQQQKPA